MQILRGREPVQTLILLRRPPRPARALRRLGCKLDGQSKRRRRRAGQIGDEVLVEIGHIVKVGHLLVGKEEMHRKKRIGSAPHLWR